MWLGWGDEESIRSTSLFESGCVEIREVNEGITLNTEYISLDFRNINATIALLLPIEGCLVVIGS
jgi:hypothetical protein